MPLKNNLPISTMPVGKPVAVGKVDPADNPILTKKFSPQPDPVPRTPVPAPSTGGTRIPQTGGGRSGVGRLQKAGMPGVPSTPGGYNSSGIIPPHMRQGNSGAPKTGGTLPPKTRPAPKTGGKLPPQRTGGYDGSGINPGAGKPRAGNIRDRLMSKLGRRR